MKKNDITTEEQEKADKSLIGLETNIAYILAMAADVLTFDIDRQLHQKGFLFEREKKRNFTRYKEMLGKAQSFYEQTFEQDVIHNCTSFGDKYDGFRQDALDMLKLALAFGDKVSNGKQVTEIINFILSLPGGTGFVDGDTLKQFDLR